MYSKGLRELSINIKKILFKKNYEILFFLEKKALIFKFKPVQ